MRSEPGQKKEGYGTVQYVVYSMNVGGNLPKNQVLDPLNPAFFSPWRRRDFYDGLQ
jgi:hypothetical protein